MLIIPEKENPPKRVKDWSKQRVRSDGLLNAVYGMASWCASLAEQLCEPHS